MNFKNPNETESKTAINLTNLKYCQKRLSVFSKCQKMSESRKSFL